MRVSGRLKVLFVLRKKNGRLFLIIIYKGECFFILNNEDNFVFEVLRVFLVIIFLEGI